MSDEEYGNDDFLADFDVDAAVAAADNNAQANHEQTQTLQTQTQTFQTKSKFSTGIQTSPSDHEASAGFNSRKSAQMPALRYNSKKRQQSDTTTIVTSISPSSSQPNMKQMTLTNENENKNKKYRYDLNGESIDETTKSELTQTLQDYFGHKSYRPGQLSIIQSILKGQDAAVFWSTGAGKSICYQIPPLHLNQIAVVISPLISLMEDQVSKLNGLGNHGHSHQKDIAVFLGSAQTDPMAQQKALNGDYRIIYCTPEKLTYAGGEFLNDLGDMHRKGQRTASAGSGSDNHNGICLVAVDESHCVSEWGHDFRPPYRSIGNDLRSHPILRDIPILALTATAMPRVQTDILSSLHMVSPNISQQSFDRHNLILTVKRKPAGGYKTALKTFVKDLKSAKMKQREAKESTIVYCQTTNLVEEVSSWLSSQLKESSIQVEAYHGGLSSPKRTEAHINFLTGKTVVIVATIAFGMGIDKPDTRRIIHYGPPKTVEEYYQQIGRAGRDGIEAYCTMYCNSGDFESFKGDFYLGKLSNELKQAQIQSINSLRTFAMSDDTCRRGDLLKFFGETPIFGARCGTCDICKTRELHSDDLERDFGNAGARVVLYALSVLNGKQGVGTIESILKGNSVDAYRYRNGSVNTDAESNIVSMKTEMTGLKKKKMPVHYYSKDLLTALVNKEFVSTKSFSSMVGGTRSMQWSGYDLTQKGWSSLKHDEPIILPVPASVRELEEKMEEAIKKSLVDLKACGADVDQIPKKEIDEGDGEVMRSLKTWYGYLELLRRNEKLDRIDQLDDLKLRIEGWRSDMAVRYRMAPSEVMAEHLLVKVAYTIASLGNGVRLEKEALLSVGLRSGGVDDLVTVLESWMKETNEPVNGDVTSASSNNDDNNKMIFTTQPFQPVKAWEYASHKRNKKTGLYAWESSFQRFAAGEHPQAIAMSPANGRPIQVATVVGHILDGFMSGRPVDLKRLADLVLIPKKSEWDKLCQAEAETGIDVTGDPATSGAGGEIFRMSDLLVPVFGNVFIGKDYKERTESEKAQFSHWCAVLKWYMAFRRVGYIPQFQGDVKAEEVNLQHCDV